MAREDVLRAARAHGYALIALSNCSGPVAFDAPPEMGGL